MTNPLSPRVGKTTYRVNGVEYRSIEEVPAEYRAIVTAIEKNPPKHGRITVTKQNYAFSTLSEKAKDPNQKKFLEELILPNLHLMDDKAKSEVLRELGTAPPALKGFSFRIHPFIWIALGIGIPAGLLILLGH
jgi:hypothetical protein